MIRRVVCQPDRATVSDIRGGIVQEEVHHLGRGQILDDVAHPRRGASVQERGRRWSESELVTLLFEMAADREVIAKYADATNRRSGCPREPLGRGIAFRDLRKQVEFESSFDRGGLLIGEDRVHEQIRRDIGHVCFPRAVVPGSGVGALVI
jgi:hypothetical protein